MQRLDCDAEHAGVDIPRQPVARRKSEAHTFISSVNAEIGNDVLRAEVGKFKVNNIIKVKSDNCVLVPSKVPLPILLVSLMRRQPRVNLERGYTFSIEMKGKISAS
jgi:hypothetical protein